MMIEDGMKSGVQGEPEGAGHEAFLELCALLTCDG